MLEIRRYLQKQNMLSEIAIITLWGIVAHFAD